MYEAMAQGIADMMAAQSENSTMMGGATRSHHDSWFRLIGS